MQLVIESEEYNTAERIALLLFLRKMSQSALARAMGVSVAGISRRMTGATEWGLAETRRVAEVLDTTVAFIAGETDNPDRPEGLGKMQETPAASATGVSGDVVRPKGFEPLTF